MGEKLPMRNSNSRKNSQLPWWIRIRSTKPDCIYYFGPFASLQEAQNYSPGYLEDLVEEKALIVKVDIDQYQPQDLTIPSENPLPSSPFWIKHKYLEQYHNIES